MFEKVYDYQNLYDAYLKARKQKRYRKEVLSFSYALEENLIELQNELIWRTYKVGNYRPFIVYEPKKRQIVALPFRDRVVQHALNNVIEPLFDKRVIYDSYACRKGKGTHKAARRLSFFLSKPGVHYYIKADISKYFASINRVILRSILSNHIKDDGILWLLDEILNSTPETGLPIGNLMSQLFANIYLHEFDHWMKHVRGVKYYLRYMDDFIVLHASKTILKRLLRDINTFLTTKLSLRLNPKTRIDSVKNGIEFVGYRVWGGKKLIKKQHIRKMQKRVKCWRNGSISDEKLLKSFGSWIGHCADTASHKIVEKLMLHCLQAMIKRHEIAH